MKVSVGVPWPLMTAPFEIATPSFLHEYVKPAPVALTLIVRVPLPEQSTAGAMGCVWITGDASTVKATAGLDVIGGVHVPVMTTSNVAPLSVRGALVIVKVAVFVPAYTPSSVRLLPFLRHWYVNPAPVAVTLMVRTPLPSHTAAGATGCAVIAGGA